MTAATLYCLLLPCTQQTIRMDGVTHEFVDLAPIGGAHLFPECVSSSSPSAWELRDWAKPPRRNACCDRVSQPWYPGWLMSLTIEGLNGGPDAVFW